MRHEYAVETVQEFLNDLVDVLNLEDLANMSPNLPQPFELMGPGIRDDIEGLYLSLRHVLAILRGITHSHVLRAARAYGWIIAELNAILS